MDESFTCWVLFECGIGRVMKEVGTVENSTCQGCLDPFLDNKWYRKDAYRQSSLTNIMRDLLKSTVLLFLLVRQSGMLSHSHSPLFLR